jgi:hypothetical protein
MTRGGRGGRLKRGLLALRSVAPRLGANDDGAKLPATSAPRRQGHGASDHGDMLLYLSADNYGAKIRVHFLKSFHKGIFERIF